MDKKKFAYTLLIISVVIIITGTLLFLIDPKDAKPVEKEKTPEEIIELEENKLSEEHCIENICLSNMYISGNYHEYYHATVDITNKTNKVIEDKFIKILFDVEGKTIVEYAYFESLEPNETTNFVIGLTDNTLLKAKSYQIENPTAKEIEEQKALFD